jgi:hypothetical protein
MKRALLLPWLAAALLLGFARPSAGDPAETGWRVVWKASGLLIERRAGEGALYEVRATAESPLAPAAIFETLWKQREHPQFVPHLKRLDLLSESEGERLTYEQVEVPLARDRDYTVRLQRRVNPEAQRYEITFATANEAGPPPDGQHVRVRTIRGRWLVEPGPQGRGATLRYEVFTDPGGQLPSWLLNRVQGTAVAQLVRAMLQRAQEKAR